MCSSPRQAYFSIAIHGMPSIEQVSQCDEVAAHLADGGWTETSVSNSAITAAYEAIHPAIAHNVEAGQNVCHDADIAGHRIRYPWSEMGVLGFSRKQTDCRKALHVSELGVADRDSIEAERIGAACPFHESVRGVSPVDRRQRCGDAHGYTHVRILLIF
jgi:hypothetical protein